LRHVRCQVKLRLALPQPELTCTGLRLKVCGSCSLLFLQGSQRCRNVGLLLLQRSGSCGS
jgi:hypothetical protein